MRAKKLVSSEQPLSCKCKILISSYVREDPLCTGVTGVAEEVDLETWLRRGGLAVAGMTSWRLPSLCPLPLLLRATLVLSLSLSFTAVRTYNL